MKLIYYLIDVPLALIGWGIARLFGLRDEEAVKAAVLFHDMVTNPYNLPQRWVGGPVPITRGGHTQYNSEE
jgi:hypothetical protein